MSESGEDYDPGVWKGYDYTSARKAYDPSSTVDPSAGRGYGGTTPSGAGYSYTSPRSTSPDVLPPKLKTDAKYPVVVLVDGTGSMGDFPEVIFKKLPLLDLGAKDYLGDDFEISYAMIGDIGDACSPLQVRPFGRGKEMVDSLNKLVIGHGGGSNSVESYELGALYYARNVEMPKASKPIMIFVCDEGVYPTVNKDWAKSYAHVDVTEDMTDKQLFDEVKKKYSVYCIRKHYLNEIDADKMTGQNLVIQRQWVRLVGEDRIAILNDANRVVDVILGLLAVETGKEDFFEGELSERQTKDQVKTVMKAMVTVGSKDRTHADPTAGSKSVTKKPKDKTDDDGKSKRSKSLI